MTGRGDVSDTIEEKAVRDNTDARVIHPTHYNNHPSGVECWQLTERLSFNLGNAIKYLWRAGAKHDAQCDRYIAAVAYYGSTPAGIKRAAQTDLPCAHCARLDRDKAANYLRTEGSRLTTTAARAAHTMAIHDARSILRRVTATDPHSHLGFVLQALLDQADLGLIANVVDGPTP